MQPEAVVLQKPMDPAQATLANGVYCGDVFKRLTLFEDGWSSSTAWTNYLGYDTPGEMDVGFPGGSGRILTRSGKSGGGVPPKDNFDALGRSILAVKINDAQGWAAVLIDRGPDDDNPGAQDCEVIIGKFADVLTPDLIAALRFKLYIRRTP